MHKNRAKKVYVGLSGGVDSSVSLAVLKAQGYDVHGVFIKTWQPDWLPCTWKDERRSAMRVASHFNVPFTTLDLEKEYKNGVVDYMIEEYKKGRTPNPDVMCNKEVKFGAFLRWALDKKQGGDFVATGHYAQSIDEVLVAGNDKNKDQSYFLWTLKPSQLSKILFPVGDLNKPEVRKRAKLLGLPNAEKKDSQGLCFMGKVDMKDFLSKYIETKNGNVLDEDGNVIGTHNGALLYTIGERHGFHVEKSNSKTTSTNEEPLFIISKDLEKNTITVSKNNPNIVKNNNASEIVEIRDVNLNPNVKFNVGDKALVKVRYRQENILATLTEIKAKENDVISLKLSLSGGSHGATKGQSLVIYEYPEGKRVIGGGIIE